MNSHKSTEEILLEMEMVRKVLENLHPDHSDASGFRKRYRDLEEEKKSRENGSP